MKRDMLEENLKNLRQALSSHFDDQEAACLASLFLISLDREITPYESLADACPDVDDGLLTAFGERVLLPISGPAASAWEDKSLRLCPGEQYFMPSVARSLLRHAAWSGRFDTDQALSGVLSIDPAADLQPLVRFVRNAMGHATSRCFEAGLMLPLARSMELRADLHETVDFLVASGVISPCKRAGLASGLSWYEFNPCLYWESPSPA
jgi:hypothetical protein